MKGIDSCSRLMRWPLTYPVNLLWQVILGQGLFLQFDTAPYIQVYELYGGSSYSESFTVDYLCVLGIGSHV